MNDPKGCFNAVKIWLTLVIAFLAAGSGAAHADCAVPQAVTAPGTESGQVGGIDCFDIFVPESGLLTITVTSDDEPIGFFGTSDDNFAAFVEGFGESVSDTGFLNGGESLLVQVFSQTGLTTPSFTFTTEFEPTAIDPNVQLFSAVLPSGRSGVVGTLLTARATIINAGFNDAIGCTITPTTTAAADFFFRPTNDTNGPIPFPAGTALDIPNFGGRQDYIFGFTPTAEIAPTEIELEFSCENGAAAPVFVGLNTFQLSASATPVADVVARSATLSNNGTAELSAQTGSGIFAAAATNLGPDNAMNATVRSTNLTLPLQLGLCQTDPSTGVCINPVDPSGDTVSLNMATDEVTTFGVFIEATADVPTDPAANRLVLEFIDAAGVSRGSTSVAVATNTSSF